MCKTYKVNGKAGLLSFRKETLESYTKCLHLWHTVNFNSKFSFSAEASNAHLRRVFEPFTLEQLPKVFKGMLADHFSIQTGQERPEVPVSGFKLFYTSYFNRLTREISKSRAYRVRLFWDLMQSKSLSKEAHESFIRSNLVKHRNTVSKVTQVDSEILDSFRQFIQPWVEEISRLMDSIEIPLASTHACYETPRSKGGVSAHWEAQDLDLEQPSEPRVEPTTIALIGPPGCGKSLIQSRLQTNLAHRLKKTFSETGYSRNAASDHWDGYQQQPLVIVDDFLQYSCHTRTEVPTQITEFVTVSSTTDYIPPMAHLDQKGMKFTSPLILYSTNKSVKKLHLTLGFAAESEDAIKRRFDFYCIKVPGPNPTWEVRNREQQLIATCDSTSDFVQTLEEYMITSWRKKCITYNQYFDQVRVPIKGLQGTYYQVPGDLGHNRVKVVPLVEPLKVRTITVGHSANYTLKPLQQIMLRALRKFPEFLPCFTPDYQKEIISLFSKGPLWLSGDYSSATDGLCSDIMRVAVEELCQVVPEWMKPFLIREADPHFCEYPKCYDIDPVYQTNGQLMGSLLSFPILCLANAFTLGHATGTVLGSLPGLIHGDDLLARITTDQIDRWKSFCPEIGLELSIGKNYVSDSWGSIDSQVFYGSQARHLDTGKYTCFVADQEGKITQLLKRGITKALAVSLGNKYGLWGNTPRSIDVSTQYGGLGLEGIPSDDLSRTVCADFIRKRIANVEKRGDYFIYHLPESLLRQHKFSWTEEEVTVVNTHPFKFIKYADRHKLRFNPFLGELPATGCVMRSSRDPILENLVLQTRDFYMGVHEEFSF